MTFINRSRATDSTADVDKRDLESFGYKQGLHRSLGQIEAFATSYGWVAIFVGVSSLFYLGFAIGGPAFVWVYPVVGAITMLVCLLFAEFAGQVPLSGSVYLWSRQVTALPFVSWLLGILTCGAILVASDVVGPVWQLYLTTISRWFEFVGGIADVGSSTTHDGAINAIILGTIGLLIGAVINIIGVKWTGRVTTVIVAIELAAVGVALVALLLHARRGLSFVFQSFGTGAGHPWGYFGAFLAASVAGAYVFYGFENAATVAEETKNPRRRTPRAIIGALTLSIVVSIALALAAEVAVPNLRASGLSTSGFPFALSASLGSALTDVLLVGVSISMLGATVVVQAAFARILYAMARDNQVPWSRQIAFVSKKWGTPVVAICVVTIGGIVLLFVNFGNPAIFSTIAGVEVVLYYLVYFGVALVMLHARISGRWPMQRQDPTRFSLGKWGIWINVAAVILVGLLVINVAWPRPVIYGSEHWYFQWGAILFTGALIVFSGLYYVARVRGRRTSPSPPPESVSSKAM